MTNKLEQKQYLTTETRWRNALAEVQSKGVLVYDNYPACCGSCAYAEIEDTHPGTDHISFINSQGRGVKFINGVAYNYEMEAEYDEDTDDYTNEVEVTRLAERVYWTHSTGRAAHVAFDAFVAQGFEVDWNGSDARCVEVKFPAGA